MTTVVPVLALFAVVVLLRMPHVVLDGRFWAEEGTHFFAAAWQLPPLRALLEPYGGSLDLPATAGTVLARWTMPLRLAPYVTISLALLIQLLPPFIILRAADAWLGRPRIRIAAILLILFAANSDETWLQTLHSQFQSTLACGLILALDVPEGGKAAIAWRLAALALAPLCGTSAFALLPLFLLRAMAESSRGRAIQFGALGAGMLIQIAFFFTLQPGGSASVHPVLYLCMLTVRHLAVPFLGVPHGQTVAAAILATLDEGRVPIVAVLLPIVAFGGLGVVAIETGLRRPALWLFLGAFAVSVGSFLGVLGGALAMIDPHYGERYVFVPQVLLSLGLLALAATASRAFATVAGAACVWLLVTGMSGYFFPWSFISNGPAWRPQVAAWRNDPTRPLHVWPGIMVLRLQPDGASATRPRASA